MSFVFLNSNQAKSGELDGIRLPDPYVWLCRFLGCGAIDRTQTLDQGFEYHVLDPLPEPSLVNARFDEICDARAASIVDCAIRTAKKIRVLWSGGIDSTAALIAIIKATEACKRGDLIHVVLTIDSIHEYPRFYQQHIVRRCPVDVVPRPLSACLRPDAINVTGSHGDQLYGSHLLRHYIEGGLTCLPYGNVLPLVFADRLGSSRMADGLMRYVEPQIAAAPVAVNTLFECLWWLEYSLKWQQIALRLQAFRNENVRLLDRAVEHFYRTETFQQWSMSAPDAHVAAVWNRYKEPSKKYILSFTNDVEYYRTKCKELSVKRVIVTREQREKYRALVYMRDASVPVIQLVARS